MAGVVLVTLFIILGLVHMAVAWRDRGKALPLGWLAGVNGVVALAVNLVWSGGARSSLTGG